MSKMPIDIMLDQVDWTPLIGERHGAGPYATHRGTLTIGDVHLRVYQLDDGRRLIDAEDFHRLFGVPA